MNFYCLSQYWAHWHGTCSKQVFLSTLKQLFKLFNNSRQDKSQLFPQRILSLIFFTVKGLQSEVSDNFNINIVYIIHNVPLTFDEKYGVRNPDQPLDQPF